MGDDDPQVTFGYVAEKLNAYGLAYLHLVNPNKSDAGAKVMKAMWKNSVAPPSWPMVSIARRLRPGFKQGKADLIAFGRSFLANPDLPERFRQPAELNADDLSTYYGGGAKGYTDYPTLAQERGEELVPCVDARWR